MPAARHEHERPHRPSRLSKRLTPPPERGRPPDLTWFAYIGLVLALVVVVLLVPYLIAYVVELISS